MRKLTRPPQPGFLKNRSKQWGKEFARKKERKKDYVFTWRQYKGRKVDKLLMPLLVEMTNNHCSFCDGYPLGETGRQTIEHFKPKGRFPLLAYTWTNLFLCCDVCQNAKQEKYDEKLLKPDHREYDFFLFFINNYRTGKIEPNPASPPEFQERAEVTILLYDLNNKERINSRKRMFKLFMRLKKNEQIELLDEFPYRCFLVSE